MNSLERVLAHCTFLPLQNLCNVTSLVAFPLRGGIYLFVPKCGIGHVIPPPQPRPEDVSRYGANKGLKNSFMLRFALRFPGTALLPRTNKIPNQPNHFNSSSRGVNKVILYFYPAQAKVSPDQSSSPDTQLWQKPCLGRRIRQPVLPDTLQVPSQNSHRRKSFNYVDIKGRRKILGYQARTW